MKFAASSLALGCTAVTVDANSANSLELNGIEPLSLSSCTGVPCIANVFLQFSLVGFILVEYTTSTSRYLVRLSMTTRS